MGVTETDAEYREASTSLSKADPSLLDSAAPAQFRVNK